jgi:hypothetical protein
MAAVHGRRRRVTVLAGPHRYKLVQQLADAREVKVADIAREALYEYARRQEEVSVLDWEQAVIDDEREEQDGKQARVEGRLRRLR